MTGLSEATWSRIRQLFPSDLHPSVAEILEHECGNNLPFLEPPDASALERFHFAALTLRTGSLNGLRDAVDLAKINWRDLLVAASEADSPNANKWWRIRLDPRDPTVRSQPSKAPSPVSSSLPEGPAARLTSRWSSGEVRPTRPDRCRVWRDTDFG
ncbi:MAG TPA: hypothetical protein VJK02_20630 [Anaerolineales bacterium]|nr:hypothetical protein [Anaerolineales bacterium]